MQEDPYKCNYNVMYTRAELSGGEFFMGRHFRGRLGWGLRVGVGVGVGVVGVGVGGLGGGGGVSNR